MMKKILALALALTFSATALADGIAMSSGRFQLVQLSAMRRDQYLIDTQTGRIWNNVCAELKGEECVQNVWQEMHVSKLAVPKSKTTTK